MKYFVIFFLLAVAGCASVKPDLNKKLYEAVVAKDAITVRQLLESGADANYRKKDGWFEMSLLIWSVQKQDFKIVKLLVEHKADVNFQDAFKTTALMYAANTGNIEIVSYLLSKGADVDAVDQEGNSVLSEGKNQAVIELIGKLQKENK